MSNVLNRFEQPNPSTNDNRLILGGTAQTGGGVNIKRHYVTIYVHDIGAASTVAGISPVAGTISDVRGVTRANTSDAATTITAYNGTDSMGAASFNTSAVPATCSIAPSGTPTIAAGGALQIASGGQTTNTGPGEFVIAIDVA